MLKLERFLVLLPLLREVGHGGHCSLLIQRLGYVLSAMTGYKGHCLREGALLL